MEDTMYFRQRNEWRNWLIKNHNKGSPVWLLFHRKSSCKESINLEEAVEEALCFGWIDGKLRKVDHERFIVRFSIRKSSSVWSKINKERAEKLIEAGKMTSAGMSKIQAAKESGSWDNAYTNKKKDPTPPDLEEALMNNKEAWVNFQNFANSYKNMYIGWINAAKTGDTRNRRIKKVVEQSFINDKQFGAEGRV